MIHTTARRQGMTLVFPCVVKPGAGGFLACCQGRVDGISAHYDLLGGAALVLLVSFLLRRLLPAWGMRTLLVPGAIALAYVVFADIQDPKGDLMPVFLAGALFMYVWWLVALVFDLIFVWHRYIRYSREGRYLRYPSSSAGKAPSSAAQALRPSPPPSTATT
jgi:hypothetical protein